MALSKPMKKENSNKFEPKLDVPYDVKILGFVELGTQETKDFNSKDDDAKVEQEQIAVVLQFIGYTEETEEEDEEGDPVVVYTPCVKKAGGKEYPQVETMIKNLSTGAKSFVGQIFDAAGPKVRDQQGNVDPVKAVGKLITMTRIIEPIAGKDQEIWKPTRMAAAQKKQVEIVDELPTFLFDLLDADGQPADGFVDDFDAEFPEGAGMMLVSKLIASSEYVDLVEGTECTLDLLIEELRETHGTFDDKPTKKKPASRKAADKPKPKPKPKPKAAAKVEDDEGEVDDDNAVEAAATAAANEAREKKEKAAKAKAKKEAAAKAKSESAEETEEEAEARELAEFKAKQKAKKEAAKAKAKAAEGDNEGDDEDPF